MLTLDDIQLEWDTALKMGTTPNLPRYAEKDVLDEYQSVKWNREQVAQANEAYKLAEQHLIKEKQDAENEVLEKIYAYVQQELNCTRKQAEYVYGVAYADGHCSGTDGILGCLEANINYLLDFNNAK